MKNLNKSNIELAAYELNAGSYRIYKWRHRQSVPAKWRILISEHLDITPADVTTAYKIENGS
jgi:hypothetical protein